jgi:hypothetical protein
LNHNERSTNGPQSQSMQRVRRAEAKRQASERGCRVACRNKEEEDLRVLWKLYSAQAIELAGVTARARVDSRSTRRPTIGTGPVGVEQQDGD